MMVKPSVSHSNTHSLKLFVRTKSKNEWKRKCYLISLKNISLKNVAFLLLSSFNFILLVTHFPTILSFSLSFSPIFSHPFSLIHFHIRFVILTKISFITYNTWSRRTNILSLYLVSSINLGTFISFPPSDRFNPRNVRKERGLISSLHKTSKVTELNYQLTSWKDT